MSSVRILGRWYIKFIPNGLISVSDGTAAWYGGASHWTNLRSKQNPLLHHRSTSSTRHCWKLYSTGDHFRWERSDWPPKYMRIAEDQSRFNGEMEAQMDALVVKEDFASWPTEASTWKKYPHSLLRLCDIEHVGSGQFRRRLDPR